MSENAFKKNIAHNIIYYLKSLCKQVIYRK